MLNFHTNKPRKWFPFALTVLWITGICIGCTKNATPMQMHSSSDLVAHLPLQSNQVSSTVPEASNQKPALTVVLLHGLDGTNVDMQPIADKISDQFGNRVRILQPEFRAHKGWWVIRQSIKQSIDNQAERLFTYIQENLADAAATPLLIIGYSQGGNLACIFAHHYKDRLHIDRILALGAPLGGVPALQRTGDEVQNFLNNSATQAGWQWILPRNNLSEGQISSYMQRFARGLGVARVVQQVTASKVALFDGAHDILPDSQCVKEVSKFLREESHNIPCLLFAGHQNDFSEIFPIEYKEGMDLEKYTTDVKQFNNTYAEFVTEINGGLHDGLIPLRSQLCRTDSFEDLEAAKDTRDPLMVATPNRPHIKGYIYKNILHSRKFITLHGNLKADKAKTIHTSERVLDDIMGIIEERLQTYAPEPKSLTAQMQDLALS